MRVRILTTRRTRTQQATARRWTGMGIALALVLGFGTIAAGSPAQAATDPNLGEKVIVFDPSMPTAAIQARVDAIAAQQVGNQFGPERFALLFKPGTYGTPQEPLNFQVGYYTEVAGLGQSPDDVTINGSVYVRNQCDAGNCVALNNFWRSLSNLRINVTTPGFGCYTGEFWAVSQAAPMRRVHVNGFTTLMDYCTGPSYASGGFIADSQFDGGTIVSGSQQQWLVRDSVLDGWSNGVWNQVFTGTVNAPATCFPAGPCGGPYTTVAATPVSKEKPYLYVDGAGNWNVFVPSARTNASGPTWSTGRTAGNPAPLSTFFIARPTNSVDELNHALDRGQNLLFTPGVYNVDDTIEIKRPGTIVLGLGLATIKAVNGALPMKVEDVNGVDIAGLTFDAGEKNSPALLRIGGGHGQGAANNPTALQDIFFRIGGAAVGKATTSLIVDGDNVILDDIWAWRADHGAGVGWTQNTADTGVIVNGNNVTATGLFVEHYQKTEVIWNGENGRTVFFQNEMPYDVPSQAAWMDGSSLGYPAYRVADRVRNHEAWGLGSYSFFNQGVDIHAARAFQVPRASGIRMHNMLTIFLNASDGSGAIDNVINDVGGSSSIANPDTPVTVVSYP